MMDPEAVLYFRSGDCIYRVKVFAVLVWLERQRGPRGDNVCFIRAQYPVFDGEHWDINHLAALVDHYETGELI